MVLNGIAIEASVLLAAPQIWCKCPNRAQTHSLVKFNLCSFCLPWSRDAATATPPAPSQRHYGLVHSADQIILSATTTTVATETLHECLGVCVVLLGIGCRGLDVFQSDLLLGCVRAPPTHP